MHTALLTITGPDVKHSIAIDPQGVVTGITEQLAQLRARIEGAARKAGRDPAAVRLLAVSKRQPVSRIREAVSAGLTDFGENYPQEALDKIDQLPDLCWHYIGQIQSNKTRSIATHFDWVQSLSDERNARRLSSQRPETMADLQVCIQLQPRGGERGGLAPEAVPQLAALIAELPRLHLRGLMVMPLPGRSTAELRAEFAAGRECCDSLRRQGHDLDTLSMGMSDDLEAAVMEGSTLVRIGTGLFGPRP